MKRVFFPVVLGVVGCAVLVSLGIWQVQRLAWKEAMLAQIEARIDGPPAALPDVYAPSDKYMPVVVSGRLTGQEVHALMGVKGGSPGYRVIAVLDTGARRVMVDLGVIAQADKDVARLGVVEVTGNLHWPEEADRWTPPADMVENIWFARDVPAMAQALGAEPMYIVARARSVPGVDPAPVGTQGIPNDHFGYAVTWFGLALVWAVMSLYLIRRVMKGD